MGTLYIVHALHTTGGVKTSSVLIVTEERIKANEVLLSPERGNHRFVDRDTVTLSVCELDKPYTLAGTAAKCVKTRRRDGTWNTDWNDLHLEVEFEVLSR